MPQPQEHQRIPSTLLLRQFNAAPPGKLFCLHGDRSVFRLSLYAASHALLAGVPIALLDGSNRFDVYYIAEFARRAASSRSNITPEQLLERIFVSRAFTCYQREASITDRLPKFLTKKNASVAIIFGLLDTFYDEQAPLFEVRASVQRIIAALHQLKRNNISVLLASCDVKLASHERNALFPKLLAAMDESYTMAENENGPKIFRDSKHSHIRRTHNGTHSANIYDGHSTGNGKLVEVSPRTAQGRSRRTR
jgi:hypothetical protein